jgi:hypothetical protein
VHAVQGKDALVAQSGHAISITSIKLVMRFRGNPYNVLSKEHAVNSSLILFELGMLSHTGELPRGHGTPYSTFSHSDETLLELPCGQSTEITEGHLIQVHFTSPSTASCY